MSDQTIQMIVMAVFLIAFFWAMEGFPAFWRKPPSSPSDDEDDDQ